MNNIKFDYHELPNAYLTDNPNSKELRKQLIRNEVKICSDGDLETLFFSDENMDLLNKKIILAVFNITDKKVKINNQSKESLIIVLRYVFIEFAKHLPFNTKKQVCELNNIVLKEILPGIITNITQKITYLENMDKPRFLLDLPVNTTKKNILEPISSLLR